MLLRPRHACSSARKPSRKTHKPGGETPARLPRDAEISLFVLVLNPAKALQHHHTRAKGTMVTYHHICQGKRDPNRGHWDGHSSVRTGSITWNPPHLTPEYRHDTNIDPTTTSPRRSCSRADCTGPARCHGEFFHVHEIDATMRKSQQERNPVSSTPSLPPLPSPTATILLPFVALEFAFHPRASFEPTISSTTRHGRSGTHLNIFPKFCPRWWLVAPWIARPVLEM